MAFYVIDRWELLLVEGGLGVCLQAMTDRPSDVKVSSAGSAAAAAATMLWLLSIVT